MIYRPQLELLQAILEKLHVQCVLVEADRMSEARLDFGLRDFFGLENDYRQMFEAAMLGLRDRVVYKMTDEFSCRYVLLLLPGVEPATVLLVGPYLPEGKRDSEILEEIERFNIPPGRLVRLQEYYSNIPILDNEITLFACINAFAEAIWGRGRAFEIVDVNQVLNGAISPLHGAEEGDGDILLKMDLMEKRYAYENELIQIVSQGLAHRAELLMGVFSTANFEVRTADPVRNMKNYGVICNTLLRKAAEQGGVHPIYLDRVSADYARRIEQLSSLQSGGEILQEMVHAYCRLVRKHSMKNYSPQVRKAVTYIDTDLTQDLSLQTLAEKLGVNASYLSTLFRRETGQTVTDFVNRRRVDMALKLLGDTGLQVQTVAQHCGMSDVNYFSKVFKKYIGVSPREYRRRQLAGGRPE